MKRANSLVGLLVVVVIIAILAVVFMRGNNAFSAAGTGSPRPDGKGTTIPGLLIAKAKDDVCLLHLKDLRMALSIVHDNGDDKWPATLEETKQGSEFYSCPLGHEPYKYNSETGDVKCVHPGHEKY